LSSLSLSLSSALMFFFSCFLLGTWSTLEATYLPTPSFFSCSTLHTLTPVRVNSLIALLCFLLGTKSLLHDLFSSVSVQWFFSFFLWGDNFFCFFHRTIEFFPSLN
jgi:hypothetical protein